MTYKDTLTKWMNIIAEKENSVFIGQQIVWRGNPLSETVLDINKNKLIEVPLIEESQMGMTLGMAINGDFVVSFYPRWNFLLLATSQLINNLDKFEAMTGVKPHIIIRVGKGATKPLDPGYQHKGYYFDQLKDMATTIKFIDCKTISDIDNAYEIAINNKGIYVISEYHELYNSKT